VLPRLPTKTSCTLADARGPRKYVLQSDLAGAQVGERCQTAAHFLGTTFSLRCQGDSTFAHDARRPPAGGTYVWYSTSVWCGANDTLSNEIDALLTLSVCISYPIYHTCDSVFTTARRVYGVATLTHCCTMDTLSLCAVLRLFGARRMDGVAPLTPCVLSATLYFCFALRWRITLDSIRACMLHACLALSVCIYTIRMTGYER
jgi:hypothetical protein